MNARVGPEPGSVPPGSGRGMPATVSGVTARGYLMPIALCGLLLLVGAASVLWYLQRETRAMHLIDALEGSERFVQSATQFRNFYSAEIVPRAKEAGMPITHAYRTTPGSLPLPATFMLDFGEFMGRQQGGFKLSLFSEYPFPWRAVDRDLDAFQRDAIAALKAEPDRPFYRVEEIDGMATLRYASADRMTASCVACHNSYPGSPKVDWKLGDIRGVLETRKPMAGAYEHLRTGLRNAIGMSAAVVAAAMLLIGVAFRGLRATMNATERLAAETHEINERLHREVLRRSEIEASLRFNEGKLRAMFEGMLDGVLVFDRSHRIVQSNRVASTMFGLPSDALLGMALTELLPSDGAGLALADGTAPHATGDAPAGRRRLEGRRGDGSSFPADVAVSELHLGDEPFYAAIVTDVTARVEHERALSAARDAALDSVRSKSEFLANMSHEIRTPMNGVIGMTGLLLDTPMSGEQREMVETVQRSADSLLTIIDDILDVSKIEAGKLRLQFADFDPVETLEDTLELVADRAASKGVALGYLVEGTVPHGMHGDEVRFRQVLSNLLSNAVKFTDTGSVQAVLAFRAESRLLEVRVRDTGPGIAQSKLHHLFQPFSQVDGSTTRRYGGTGLGLAISRQLVELMGGGIGVATKEGQGSQFHFTVGWRAPVSQTALPDARARLAGRRIVTLGLDALQQAQLRSWGVANDGSAADPDPASDAVKPDLLLVGVDTPDAPVVAARLSGELGPGAGGGPRVALVARRPVAAPPDAAGPVRHLAWPLRARSVAALLDAAPSAADAPQDSVPIAEPATDDATTAAAAREVLVVEDNPVNQTLIVALLRKAGLAATVADNGEAGLERLRERRWDLVLMDCQMPVLDGFEATRRWREHEAQHGLPRTPVIALTANAMAGDRERCLAAGMDDYLSKPIDRSALAARLATWLS
jgi:PAS domain S-box-containing protein